MMNQRLFYVCSKQFAAYHQLCKIRQLAKMKITRLAVNILVS